MPFAKSLGATALALALVACGGGDSSPPATGSGGSGGGSGGGGSTPAPSPTPTYQTFAELTGVQQFDTTCGGTVQVLSGDTFTLGGIKLGNGITITSDRSQPNYEITTDGTGLFGVFSTSFSQADRDTSRQGEVYARVTPNGFTERLAIFGIQDNGVLLDYVRVAQVLAETAPGEFTNQLCAFGVPTVSSDTPATSVTYGGVAFLGTATLRPVTNVAAVERYVVTASVVSLSGNPGTGQIDFTLDLKGQLTNQSGTSPTVVDFGTYSGTSIFDATEPGYSDIFVNSNNTVVGTFGGGFFGPQGRTAAVSVSISEFGRADGNDLAFGGLFILRPQ